MFARLARPMLAAGLVALVAGSAAAQSIGRPSAAKENAEGDRNGAIRALGATGFNDRGDAKPPPVDVPPLNEGPAGTGGVPRGTVSGSRR